MSRNCRTLSGSSCLTSFCISTRHSRSKMSTLPRSFNFFLYRRIVLDYHIGYWAQSSIPKWILGQTADRDCPFYVSLRSNSPELLPTWGASHNWFVSLKRSFYNPGHKQSLGKLAFCLKRSLCLRETLIIYHSVVVRCG